MLSLSDPRQKQLSVIMKMVRESKDKETLGIAFETLMNFYNSVFDGVWDDPY